MVVLAQQIKTPVAEFGSGIHMEEGENQCWQVVF